MPRPVHPLVRFAVARRVTMGMAVVGVLVLGWISLQRLPLEFLPSFSSSSITVQAPYPSSSPEEVERLVVQPLEASLATLNNIETLSASASTDAGRVRLTFLDGTDMDLAAVDVRDRIDRVRHLLPEDLENLSIRRFQTTDIPVIRFHVSARWPKEELYDFVEKVLQRRLERLEGVAQVSVEGLRTPTVQIDLDPARMRSHGVDARSLVNRLRRENRNLSAGDVKEGSRKLRVRALGELTTLDEIRRLPLDERGLRLGDVADVSYTFARQETFNFLNGVEALTIYVNKVSTSNVLEVADRIRGELAAVQNLPEAEGVEVHIFADASDDVRQGLRQLRDAGLFGGGLAILTVFLFLRRFRTTLLIALAVPVSVIAAFVLIYLLRQAGISDITLNVVSLAGLMLALGMLVDPSVVVIESIFRHRNELGEDAEKATLEGASEVALPVLASTATTLCVFLPIMFLGGGGRMKLYLQNIATTVSIVIAASLVVALTVVPMIAVRILRHQASRPTTAIASLTAIYGRVLAFTLRHRFLFVVSIVIMLAGSIYLFFSIERSFAARSEERQVTLFVDTPRQYSLEQTEDLYAELYALFDRRRAELDLADIAYTYDRGTGRSRGGWRRTRRLELFLVDEAESQLTTAEVRNRVRELLPVKAGVQLRIAQGHGHGSSSGLELELMGDEPAMLESLSRRLVGELAQIPEVRDVDTSLESGDEEIRVRPQGDRMLQAGLSSQQVAFTVSSSLSSRAVSHFKTADREVDLVVQYREEDRETLDQLKNVPIFGSGDTPLPLGAVADFSRAAGPRSIDRENYSSKVTITANLTDARSSFTAMGKVRAIMSSLALPPGYSWSFGRWQRRMEEDQAGGNFALAFAAVLVYMLMAALFESLTQPFTIMFSIPFALLGVGVAMKLANQPWDTMTLIGLIILLGVVVNNAIVLIDHINLLRKSGLDRDDAIIHGGQHRLRPILITAVTTLVGMLPLVAPLLLPSVFGPVEGRSATWVPIGLVILGGLTTSTFLTLLIIPTIYSLIDDLGSFLGRVRRAL